MLLRVLEKTAENASMPIVSIVFVVPVWNQAIVCSYICLRSVLSLGERLEFACHFACFVFCLIERALNLLWSSLTCTFGEVVDSDHEVINTSPMDKTSGLNYHICLKLYWVWAAVLLAEEQHDQVDTQDMLYRSKVFKPSVGHARSRSISSVLGTYTTILSSSSPIFSRLLPIPCLQRQQISSILATLTLAFSPPECWVTLREKPFLTSNSIGWNYVSSAQSGLGPSPFPSCFGIPCCTSMP